MTRFLDTAAAAGIAIVAALCIGACSDKPNEADRVLSDIGVTLAKPSVPISDYPSRSAITRSISTSVL